MQCTVNEAATKLGVTPRRVLALVAQERLPAKRLGRQWLVTLDDSFSRRTGRPLTAGNAWAMLAWLSGEPPGLDPGATRRLRSYMSDPGRLVDLIATCAPRFSLHPLRVLDRDVEAMAADARLVRTGLSGDVSAIGLVPLPAPLDVYAAGEVLDEIRRRFQPIENPEACNLVVRVPNDPWILSKDIATPPVLAADLLSDRDPRVRQAARRALECQRI